MYIAYPLVICHNKIIHVHTVEPAIADTLGTIRSVLYKEVSLIQGLIDTNMVYVGPNTACPYFRVSTLRGSTVRVIIMHVISLWPVISDGFLQPIISDTHNYASYEYPKLLASIII